MFRPRRWLTLDHARRIRDRELPDYARAHASLVAYAAERGYSTHWWGPVDLRVRLALAVRGADGDDLVAEETLDDLPQLIDVTAEVLRRAEVLRPRRGVRPVATVAPHRSCARCGSWGSPAVCASCRAWDIHPMGDCSRCRRRHLPLLAGLCRACHVHVDVHGSETLAETHIQLWFGGPTAPTARTRAGILSSHHRRARKRAAAARRPPRPVSPHLLIPGQDPLFETRRDWSCIAVGSLTLLPGLTAAATSLLAAFQSHARDQHWQPEVRRLAARTLRIVLAWLGAQAPIPEADIRSLPADRPGTSARRVVEFLADRDLLLPDPTRRIDRDEQAIEDRIQTLPVSLAAEVRCWVKVLRGSGHRRHPTTSFETIRRYLRYLYPILRVWADRVTSLREITPDDIRDVLRQQTGHTTRSTHTALRSLFRALKQERLVFRDPTRGITVPQPTRLPIPVPTDRLRGLIDRSGGPMAQLTVALVAIHGLSPLELLRLRLDDVDLAHGRVTVRRDTSRHTVYLDELTHTLIVAWLRERHRRWPVTANPHLFVSQQSAVMTSGPPASRLAIRLVFWRLGLSSSTLRQDRILDEARQTADPVHLMRVYGIAVKTAMRYVYAAHPERRSTLPR
jgi:integrase